LFRDSGIGPETFHETIISGGESDPLGYLGDTSIEAEFLDGQTNRVVGQFVDDEAGRKFVVDTSGGLGQAIDAGVSSYAHAYSTWGYARQAYYWARRFRNALDRLHGMG